MAKAEIYVDIRRKWWVMPSFAIVNGLYRATGYCPDLEKLADLYAKHGFVYPTAHKAQC